MTNTARLHAPMGRPNSAVARAVNLIVAQVHRQFVDPRAAVHKQDHEPQVQSVDYADPNDELTRLLRLGAEPVPFDDVDWNALQARIQQGAQVKQIDTSELSWWRFTAHWSRVLVPVSAAAAIVALALLSSAPTIEHQGLRGAAGNDALLQAAVSGSDVHGGALYSSDVTDWFATEYTKSR